MKSTCKKVEQTHWFRSGNETSNRQSNLWQSLYQLTWGFSIHSCLKSREDNVFILLCCVLDFNS